MATGDMALGQEQGALSAHARVVKLVKNMVYVGVVAQLLQIDRAIVEKSVRKQFAKKQKIFDLNFGAAKAGYDYAASTLTKQDPFFVEP
jgi:2-oxoglutarate/2-oxoacid ferredoxin oxidoreductase subunit alpha